MSNHSRITAAEANTLAYLAQQDKPVRLTIIEHGTLVSRGLMQSHTMAPSWLRSDRYSLTEEGRKLIAVLKVEYDAAVVQCQTRTQPMSLLDIDKVSTHRAITSLLIQQGAVIAIDSTLVRKRRPARNYLAA